MYIWSLCFGTDRFPDLYDLAHHAAEEGRSKYNLHDLGQVFPGLDLCKPAAARFPDLSV